MANRTALFGRSQPGGVFTIADLPEHPGNIWFVDSGCTTGGDAAGFGQNPDIPFLTLDYAIGQCEENNGDVIYVMPGHTETWTTTGAKIVADKAGLTVICLGEGAARPTFSFGHTGTTCTFSAASFKMKNFLFVTAVDLVTTYATVSGADCELEGEVRDATNKEVLNAFTVTGARFKAKILHRGYTSGDANVSTFSLNGVAGADIHVMALGKATVGIVNFVTAASSDVLIDGVFLVTSTTDLSKNVVATIGGNTWQVQGFDLGAGCSFSGGSGAAMQKDDVGALAADIITIDGIVDAIKLQTDKVDVTSLAVSPAAGSLARFVASGGTALGTPLAASKSLVDVLGSNGTAVTDSAVSVLGAIGAQNANNAFLSDAVVADADGSVLEREEYIQSKIGAAVGASLTADIAVVDGVVDAVKLQTDKIDAVTLAVAPAAGSLARFVASGGVALGTPLASSKSLVDALGTNGTTVADSAVSVLGAIGANNADNAFTSAAVLGNHEGSVLERQEFLQSVVGAAVGASISADIAAVKADTAATLVDTAVIGAAVGVSISADIAAVKAETAAIQADLGNPSVRANFTTIEAMIGIPDAVDSSVSDMLTTGYDSTAVVANADGSVMEREQVIQAALGAPAGVSLSADVAAIKAETALIVADTTVIGTPIDVSVSHDIENVQTAVTAIKVVTDALPEGGALTTIDANVDLILADTAVIGAPAGASIAADIAAMKVDTAAILVDTTVLGAAVGASLSADIAAVKAETAAVKAVTDALPNAGALTTIDGILDDIKAGGGIGSGIVRKTVTFSNTSADVPLFTVTGDVIVRLVAVCGTGLASAGTCNINVNSNAVALIAATVSTLLAAGEIWHDATPDASVEATTVMREFIIANSNNIVLDVEDAKQVDSGVLNFYLIWTALSANGAVAAA